jgi:hypothetical protein
MAILRFSLLAACVAAADALGAKRHVAPPASAATPTVTLGQGEIARWPEISAAPRASMPRC